MQKRKRKYIPVLFLCLLFPGVLLLKFSAQDYFLRNKILKVEPKSISEECLNGVCAVRHEFSLQGLWRKFENPSVGYHSAFMDSSVEVEGRRGSVRTNSEDVLKSTWFDFHRFKLATDEYEKPFSIVTFSPEESRKKGLAHNEVYFGESSHIKALEYWWNLFNAYLYVFVGLVCLLFGGMVALSGQENSRSSLSSALILFYCLVGLSHSTDNLLYGLGVSGTFLTASVRLSFLLTVFRVGAGFLERKFKWSQLILSFCFLGTLFSTTVEAYVLHGAYRWLVLGGSLFLAGTMLKTKKYLLLPFVGYFVWDSLLIFNLLPVKYGVYLSPFSLAMLYVIHNSSRVGNVIRNHVAWMKREALKNELRKFKGVDVSDRKLEEMLGQLLESLAYNVGCSGAAVCFFRGSNPVIVQLRAGVVKYIDDGSMPRVFGRVIQTGESLWWKGDGEFGDIKGFVSDEYGSVSTIVPISLGTKVYGAISLSDFSLDHDKLMQNEDEIKIVLGSYLDLVSRYLLFRSTSDEVESHQLGSKISDEISNRLIDKGNKEEIYNLVSDAISEELGVVSMMFRFDPASRGLELCAFSGHSNVVREEWAKVPFKARKENKTSPFAVSVNEKKTVFIANIESYFSILKSKHSQNLFQMTETKGFYCAPILVEGEVDCLLVLLEKEGAKLFGSSLPAMLSNSLSYVSFKLKELAIRAREAEKDKLLSQFVPDSASEKILAGKDAVEEDFGLMVMVDLRSSTKISNVSSKWADQFVDCVEYVRAAIEPYGNEFGFKLQKINWDAFYFTLSYKEGLEFSREELEDFVSYVYQICFEAYGEFFKELGISPHHDKSPCCRIVFAEGDISRSMINVGKTHSWGIHGTIMAVICKLEDACKKIDGYFFTLGSMVEKYELADWCYTNQILESTDEGIYSFDPLVEDKAA